ncbi:hypothetical protein HXA32_20265 [Salipaludibacillus agaradhaerens]|nr:hypothetical protein [Salipaludibacillus agaradhaerens]MCR6108608.1 hypothetical protein [Salipaludibacillus agaradhaerens]
MHLIKIAVLVREFVHGQSVTWTGVMTPNLAVMGFSIKEIDYRPKFTES